MRETRKCRLCRGIMEPCKKRFGVHICMCCGHVEHDRTIASVVEPCIERRGQEVSPWDGVGGRV
jgi:hypothetical protein